MQQLLKALSGIPVLHHGVSPLVYLILKPRIPSSTSQKIGDPICLVKEIDVSKRTNQANCHTLFPDGVIWGSTSHPLTE